MARPINLTVFMTRRGSLRMWDEIGTFDREVALYRKLQERGVRVRFVTYHPHDRDYAQRLPEMEILTNRLIPDQRLYPRLIPFLHARALAQTDVIKTNQINGAQFAVFAARVWRKPLIARMGYMWSLNTSRKLGNSHSQTRRALEIETQVCSAADQIVVTTAEMKYDLMSRLPETSQRITVIPNYVDTGSFSPQYTSEKCYDLIFIGRLSPEKNVEALLEAIQPTSLTAVVIGQGELAEKLQSRFGNLDGRIQWQPRIPNNALPRYLNQARIFVLPSLYENHPKTLIEAMSCGLTVLGADSPGIRDMIQHGETGWLCGTDAQAIERAIRHLLSNDTLRQKLGENARAYALEHYSLERIAEREYEVIQSVVSR